MQTGQAHCLGAVRNETWFGPSRPQRGAGMASDPTFSSVCAFIKEDEPALIEAVDALLSATMVCAPAVFPATASAFLPLLAAKNELVKLGKEIFEKVCTKKDGEYTIRVRRMEAAYCLITVTAFLDELDEQVGEVLRATAGRTTARDVMATMQLADNSDSAARRRAAARAHPSADQDFPWRPTFPHPTETLDDQIRRHKEEVWDQMAEGFCSAIRGQVFWQSISEQLQSHILAQVRRAPDLASDRFRAQYYELARRFEDFAVWAGLREHAETRGLVSSLSQYVRQTAALLERASSTIDVGFRAMHEAVESIPEHLEISRATQVFDGLARLYSSRIGDPIAEASLDVPAGAARLRLPPVKEAFIPQSFQVLRWPGGGTSLEDAGTWRDLPRRDDLGAFILRYLSSPYSTECPLLILGHPGSGKSLLTLMLSAQLMSKNYSVIRVPLREVNATSPVPNQIEEYIKSVTGQAEAWARVSAAFRNAPPLVILDGYDELVQASGRMCSGYLRDVQNFQTNETVQGRPVRTIVTSRITLIDNAAIPTGATVVRLLDFDAAQRDTWIDVWNRHNADYFKDTGTEPFALPVEHGKSTANITPLAEQPLLLLMLAIYDSVDNDLGKGTALNRTLLYDSLLRRFLARQRAKDPHFRNLPPKDQQKDVDTEVRRLGVAAIGMYNRGKFHVLLDELNHDLEFFGVEGPLRPAEGRRLTQGEVLLGSFFFIRKSSARISSGPGDSTEEMIAFEFLHNTFAEFLTADFILRQAATEAATLRALTGREDLRPQLEEKLHSVDGLSDAWFASLIFTPLFTKPVVLEMMREWAPRARERKHLTERAFAEHLDAITFSQVSRILTQQELPSIMRRQSTRDGRRLPFGSHPLLGYVAIYSLNMILLRIVACRSDLVVHEEQIAKDADVTKPWDRLAHIWRAWFPPESLGVLGEVLHAERRGATVTLAFRHRVQTTHADDMLRTFFNGAMALGDDANAGLAGLVLEDRSGKPVIPLSEVQRRLEASGIHLELQVAMRQLAVGEMHASRRNASHLGQTAYNALRVAVYADRYQEAEEIAASLRRAAGKLGISAMHPEPISGGNAPVNQASRSLLSHIILDPALTADFVFLCPQGGLVFFRLLQEHGAPDWCDRFAAAIVRSNSQPDKRKLALRGADYWAAWFQLLKDMKDTWAVAWSAGGQEPRLEPNLQPLLRRAEYPEAALAWIQIMGQLGHASALSQIDPTFMYRVATQCRIDLMALRSPDAFLAYVELVEKMDSPDLAPAVGEALMHGLSQDGFLEELAERSNEAAFQWAKLACRIGSPRNEVKIPPEQMSWVFERMHFSRLCAEEPALAWDWLRLAEEAGCGTATQTNAIAIVIEWLRLSPKMCSVEKRASGLALMLKLARLSGSKLATTEIGAHLSSEVLRSPQVSAMLASMPLGALGDLRWIATTTRDDALARILRKMTELQ